MSLESINFSNKGSIDSKIKLLNDIKKIIYDITMVEAAIKNYEPPKLVITVSNAPAASEINLNRNNLIKKLSKYDIEKIIVRIV